MMASEISLAFFVGVVEIRLGDSCARCLLRLVILLLYDAGTSI